MILKIVSLDKNFSKQGKIASLNKSENKDLLSVTRIPSTEELPMDLVLKRIHDESTVSDLKDLYVCCSVKTYETYVDSS
jgi:hypothetical protein